MEHQKKILTKEKLLQKAFDSAQIGIWYWNMEHDEIVINDALANIIGYTTEELHPFNTNRWVSFCHPEDRDLMTQKLCNNKHDKVRRFSFRVRFKHKDGIWIWSQFNGEILETDSMGNPSAMSGTLTDISELYHSKNSLLYRYKIEKLVSEISSDFVGIHVQNLDKVIDQSLKKIGQLLTVDRCYVSQFKQNKMVLDNTHEWCAKGITAEMDKLQNLPSSIFPWWMKKLNKLEHIYIRQVNDLPEEAVIEKEILQEQKIISLLVVPIHYQKNLFGFIGFDSVLEEKEWLESDIHLINTVAYTLANAFNARIHHEELIQAKEEAEEGARIKSAFLATVNHELRTPLHHIMGFSELLRMNKIPTSEIAGFADKIHNSGKNLLQIIEDILNLSMADESFVKLRKELFKGNDLFIQQKILLEEMLILSTKENKIKLKFNPSNHFTQHQFIADRNKINQIIVNLLKNAVKFTESGVIEFSVEFKNNTLVFRVKDSGIGIPEHQQRLIFDFFRQADDSSTRMYSGIGVGLAISNRITKILGGQLTVTSIPERGSTFILVVPVEQVTDKKKAILINGNNNYSDLENLTYHSI